MKTKNLLKLSELIQENMEEYEHGVPGPEWESRETLRVALNRSETWLETKLKNLVKEGIAEKKIFYVEFRYRSYYKINYSKLDYKKAFIKT
jgi:hypothetical protein